MHVPAPAPAEHLPVRAWRGPRGIHLFRDCHDLGQHPRSVIADARTVRCGPCVLRSIAHTHAAGLADPTPHKSCGSHGGYNRHRARGERPCAPCRLGERLYSRERKKRQRETAARALARKAARQEQAA